MTRWLLSPLALALSLPLAGCDPEVDEPDFTGLYRLEVTGRLTPVEWDAEPLPDTIALEWPDSLDVELIEVGDEEGQVCSGGECWYGNATVRVNGAVPEAAIFVAEPQGPELRLIMDEGFLVSPVDPGDCDYFAPFVLGFQVRLGETFPEGGTRGPIECIVIDDDGTVLHQYAVEVELTMSGVRDDDGA